MASLNESSFRQQLESEGFSHTYVWQDGPNAHYPDHTHAALTAHIILDGEMTSQWAGNRTPIASVIAATSPLELYTPREWGREAVAILLARSKCC